MTERRVIRTYRPRVVIPIEQMFENQGEYGLYCLSIDGAQALSRLLPYLEREVTYQYDVIDGATYIGPNGQEMQDILDIVSDLEDSLMAQCDLSAIVSGMTSMTNAITALQCICQTMASQNIGNVWGDDLQDYLDGGQLLPGLTLPDETISPQDDEDACAIAQLYWQWMYETMTEYFLPAWRTTFDDIIPLVFAGVIAWVSGGAAALPAYGLAELLQELIEIGYDSAEADLINWYLSIKEDWVCLVYGMLRDGSTDKTIADAVKATLIDVAEDISFGDKTITSFFGGQWSLKNAREAWDDQTTWATQNVTSGFCDDCVYVPQGCYTFAPCDLDDWYDGSGTCQGSYRRHQGGTSYWTKETFDLAGMTEPWMVVTWLPTGDSDDTARARFGARRVSDGVGYIEFTTADRTQDVPVVEYFALSSQLYGEVIQFGVQQSGWYATPMLVCVYDGDPR